MEAVLTVNKRDQVIARMKVMIASTDPAMSPVAGDDDAGARHVRYRTWYQRVLEAGDNDPIIAAVAAEIGLSFQQDADD